ncbi:MAG: glycosyltransferase family 39 protein [Candidatus Bathyarchaeia archaeon]
MKRIFNPSIFPYITCILIFSSSLIPRIINLDNPGLTWDEPAYIEAGRIYVDGMLKSQIFSISIWRVNWEHPPIAKYLIGLSLHVLEPLGFSEVAAARVPNTILGSLTCLLLYLFLHDTYGESVSILASLLLSCLPNFFAHSRYAALDAPETFFIVFSLYAFKKWTRTGKMRWMLTSAVLCGLALAVKISAISLLPIILAWFLIRYHRRIKVAFLKSLFSLIFFLLLAFTFFFLSWPLLWIDPGSIIEYLNFHLHHFNIPVYYLGEVHQRAPWHYPFIMLSVTTPVSILLVAIIGIFYALKDVFRHKTEANEISILLFIWLMLTLLRVSASYGYDGVRLFLDALPAFSSLAAIGVSQLNSFLSRFSRVSKRVTFYLLSILLITSEIYACAITHPYETSYYNELVIASGGVNLFEKTYWGEVYKEVVEWLENKAPGAKVVVPIAPHLAQYYAKTLKITSNIIDIFGESPAYLAFQAREGFYFDQLIVFSLNNLKPIYMIQVNGIIIAYIFNLEDYYSLLNSTTNSSL